MKGAMALRVALVLFASVSCTARTAFRHGKRVEDQPSVVDLTSDLEKDALGVDGEGNENVEIIPTKAPAKKTGCEGVDCAKRFDDGGIFAKTLEAARGEVGEMYNHQSQTEPVVVTEGYCAKVLNAYESRAEPFWNTEKKICNPEREHVMAQCEKKVPGFIERLSQMCPNSSFPSSELNQNAKGYKKVTYVPTIPDEFVKSKIEIMADKKKAATPCPLGMKNCKTLGRTEDGKPVEEWAAFPKAPDAKVDAMYVQSQKLQAQDCASPPNGPGCDGPKSAPASAPAAPAAAAAPAK